MSDTVFGVNMCQVCIYYIPSTDWMSTSSIYNKILFWKSERRLVLAAVINFWCYQSGISHSQLKSFKVQSSKTLKKIGATKAAQTTHLR